MRFLLTLTAVLTSALLIAAVPPAAAGEAVQTDWSGGPGLSGPVTQWADRFDGSTHVSWRSVPGQLALSSTATTPVEHLINDAYYNAFDIHAVDIDRDGDMDVLATADGSNVLSLFLNDGNQPVGWTEQVIDRPHNGINAVTAADLDDDGHTDIVATAAGSSNRVSWWRNGGDQPITWGEHIIDINVMSPWGVDVADVDGDGRLDVLVAAWDGQEIAWWRNQPGNPIAWTRHQVGYQFAGAHSVHAADLDDDGDLDVLGAAADQGEVTWWRNDGGTPLAWTEFPIRTGFAGARAARAADIDDDGDLDAVAICAGGRVAWWSNDGGSPLAWTEQTIDYSFAGGHGLDVADLDGDGDLDVLGAGYNCHDIAWWRNDGGMPISWTKIIVDGAFNIPLEVDAADLDGDGDLDVLGTSMYYGEFTWWEISEFVTNGELESTLLDMSGGPAAATLAWSETAPAGTQLELAVRTGPSPSELGAWTAVAGNPANLGAGLERYLQVKLTLSTTDANLSPLLDEMALLWTPSTGIQQGGSPPAADGVALFQNVPNPFNPSTVIGYQLAADARVWLGVYDARGRLVRMLRAGVDQPAGRHRVEWNGRDARGVRVASGRYYYRLESGDRRVTRGMTLLQ
jgi:hypothetical protein